MKRILISVILAAICLSSFGQQQEEKKKFQKTRNSIRFWKSLSVEVI